MEPAAGTPVQTTSLVSRMCNVIAAPGEVFEEVKNSKPSTANWLVPVLLNFLAGVICVIVLNTQEAFVQRIHEKQNQAIEKKVQAGQMTQAQADQAEAMAAKFSGPAVMIAFGIVGTAFWVFGHLFWLALVVWLLGKWFLSAAFSYQKSLEMVGLSSMILVLGSIVTALLSAYFADLTPFNLALLDRQGDPTSFMRMALGAVDFFDLWLACVLAVGLACQAGVAWAKALVVVLIYWVLMDSVVVTLGWFLARLGSGFK